MPRAPRLITGITDRSADLESLSAHVVHTDGIVQAEQIHGTSLAAIECPQSTGAVVSGCDGLVTQRRGLLLVIRTADCLPLIVWDPIQQVVGVVHAGWRGLSAQLPIRLIGFLWHQYRSDPQDLWLGIGPSIRPCCYEVGGEFVARFGPFVQERGGRLTCDLIGCAVQQLTAAGVRSAHVLDCGECTACNSAPACAAQLGVSSFGAAGRRWYSVRREGETTGRLLSFVMLKTGLAG